jgi:uncharacterized protein YlzI (FlbEa/FlbD family)
MMFILITTTTGNEVWINPAFITVVRADDRDENGDTLIFMNGNDLPIRVTDTADEIINQIGIAGMSR